MKLYGGIDLHSNNCVVVLVDEDSHEVLRKRIDNDLSKMIALLAPYKNDISGLVVEQHQWGQGLLFAFDNLYKSKGKP
jgi:transposase